MQSKIALLIALAALVTSASGASAKPCRLGPDDKPLDCPQPAASPRHELTSAKAPRIGAQLSFTDDPNRRCFDPNSRARRKCPPQMLAPSRIRPK